MENRELEELLRFVTKESERKAEEAAHYCSFCSAISDGVIIRVFARRLGIDLQDIADEIRKEQEYYLEKLREQGVAVPNFSDVTGMQEEGSSGGSGAMAPPSQN